MPKALLIAEKPSLKRKIETVYKNNKDKIPFDMVCVAQAGHLLGLKMPNEIDSYMQTWKLDNFPWFPESFPLKVISDKDGYRQKVFDEVKAHLSDPSYDFIIHAGDSDQEGELLVRETLEYAGCTLPVKRFWLNSEQPDEILQALISAKDDSDPFYENLYAAAKARRNSDYLVGMNFSPVVSLKTGVTANVGRLKTFIIGLIAQREKEVIEFKPSSSYAIKADYGSFQSESTEIYNTEEEARIEIESLPSSGVVTLFEEKEEKEYAPKLFTLSSLQGAVADSHLTAHKIKEICQSLYEKEYLSYPRTSCEYLESGTDLKKLLKVARAFAEFAPTIDSISDSDVERVKKTKKYINDKEVSSSGHQALTPTGKPLNLSDLSSDEQTVFKAVCKQFVGIFLPPAIKKKTKVVLLHNDHEFVTNGLEILSPGYLDFFGKETEEIKVPLLAEGEVLDVKNYDTAEKKKKKPSRFTEATIIMALEKPKKYIEDERIKKLPFDCGIGMPSTRDETVEELKRLGYITSQKAGKAQVLVPTKKAIDYVKNLWGSKLFLADTTMYWEERLDKIRRGEESHDLFENEIREYIISEVKALKEKEMTTSALCKCHFCNGSVIEDSKKYFCLSCGAAVWKNSNYFATRGKRVTEKVATDLLGKGETNLMGCISKKKKTTYNIHITAKMEDGRLNYESEFIDKDEKPKGPYFENTICTCNICGSEIVETPNGFFCKNKECSHKLWKNDKYLAKLGLPMSKDIALSLFNTGKAFLPEIRFTDGTRGSKYLYATFGGKYPKYTLGNG